MFFAIPDSFADLVEDLSPSVVSIASTTIVKNNNPQDQMPRFPEGSPFDEFFKEYFERNQKRSPSERPMVGLGSGFIIEKSGIIVTNNHVIEGADEISVILYNQKEFKDIIKAHKQNPKLIMLQGFNNQWNEAAQKMRDILQNEKEFGKARQWVDRRFKEINDEYDINKDGRLNTSERAAIAKENAPIRIICL